MARKKKPETPEEFTAEMERSEKQLHYWQDREKIRRHQSCQQYYGQGFIPLNAL